MKEEDPARYALALEFQRRWDERVAAMPWWKRWIYRLMEDNRG